METGDRVDVLATIDPTLSGGESPTRVVADAATVVAVEDTSVTVAAEPEDVIAVAFALVNGFVTLTLTGG